MVYECPQGPRSGSASAGAWSLAGYEVTPPPEEQEEPTGLKPSNFLTPSKGLIGLVVLLILVGITVGIVILTQTDEEMG